MIPISAAYLVLFIFCLFLFLDFGEYIYIYIDYMFICINLCLGFLYIKFFIYVLYNIYLSIYLFLLHVFGIVIKYIYCIKK